MRNKYRLSAKIYERESEEEQILPRRIYFFSVEGNVTEKEYLENLSLYRSELGISAIVDVEVLRRSRKDTQSAPEDVIELLEEYMRLRGNGSDILPDIPEEFVIRFGEGFIDLYLNNPGKLPEKRKREFEAELKAIGYDIRYRKFLLKYQNEGDQYAILLDRDCLSHTREDIEQCIRHCTKQGYRCYIANPCFEFWLLLHLSDVKNEYADRIDCIIENPKVSAKHTFISREVSNKAHHGKSGLHFRQVYLPNIDKAVERAKDFATTPTELMDHIGCNLGSLIEEMREYR